MCLYGYNVSPTWNYKNVCLAFYFFKVCFCFDSFYFITYLCLKWRKTYFNFQRNLHFTLCLSSIFCFNANIISTVNYYYYFVVNVKLEIWYSLCCTLSVLQCLSIIVFSKRGVLHFVVTFRTCPERSSKYLYHTLRWRYSLLCIFENRCRAVIKDELCTQKALRFMSLHTPALKW